MYPADQLGIGYQEADLPDEVIVKFPDESPSTWSRSGSYFVSGNTSLRPVDGGWALFRDEDEEGDRDIQCLIAPDLLAPRVTDNFTDTYTINFDFGAEDEFINEEVTVFRRSLCRWDGLDSCGNIVELYFNPIDNSVEGQPQRLAKWTIAFKTNQLREAGPCTGSEDFIIDKSPPNNSPIGEYGDYAAGAGAQINP